MNHDTIAGLRDDYARLSAALDAAPDAASRVALKAEIVTLFRRTESAIADLAAFKETIRELVDRFKALPEDAPVPVSVRHDHIGASTYLERGWTELAGANWSAAEVMLRRAVELDATSSSARALLGWALVHQGRLDEALETCRHVVEREPNHGLAHVAMGVVCLRKGILGEAIEHLSRVAVRGGDARASLYANYWLGVVYLEREMFGDAVEFLRRALVLGPNLSEGWADLGRALWFLGRPAEAEEAWTVGSRVRHSPHASRCVAMLDTMRSGGVPPRTISP